MALRDRILKIKKDAGITTAALSHLSGVPQGTINKILNGETENPRARTLRQLAAALGCSPDAFYDAPPAAAAFDPAAPQTLPAGDLTFQMPDDSMSGARILHGDTVFVAHDPSPGDGSIAAVSIDGVVTLRRLYSIKDGLTLLSENSAFPPIVLTGDETSRVEIIGRAVGFAAFL